MTYLIQQNVKMNLLSDTKGLQGINKQILYKYQNMLVY